MSCFGCGKKYGIFCKEYGCPSCGYSYCAKCLKRPIAVPRRNNQVLNVCLICYDKLHKLYGNEKVIDFDSLSGVIGTEQKGSEKKTNLIDAAAIFDEEPPNELSTVLLPECMQTPNTSKENADIAGNLDCEISKRLQNLKSVDKLPTDDEIRDRLKGLSGMPQKDYDKKYLLLSTDQRSEQQKMNDLLEQFMGETQIDKRIEDERNDAIADIERRLKALRDAPDVAAVTASRSYKSSSNTPSDNEEDEETILKNVMEKYLAEANLPSEVESELNSSIPAPPADSTIADRQELPWCNICNEDAIYRCKGCDGELFCRQCYRECHDDDEEYRVHIKENYSAPPKFKEDHF